MKESFYLLSLGLVLLVLSDSCQPKVDIEKEKDAIKAVIQNEVDAFRSKDMDRLSSFYVQDDLNTRLQETCSQDHPIYSGWSSVKSFLEDLMKQDNPENKNIQNVKDGFIIKVKGNCAWVINKDTWTWENNNISKISIGIQTTFMEKIDGNWKISMMSCYYSDTSDNESKDSTAVK